MQFSNLTTMKLVKHRQRKKEIKGLCESPLYPAFL